MDLQHKAVPINGFKVVDEAEGIVEAFVSVTGVEDLGGDIIEPGAYGKTLKERTPKILHGHDWLQPVARTLEAKELMPGDDELPDSIKSMDGAGALYIKMQFNLDTQRGRETYSDVKFYGSDSEWSIGYSIPRGGSKYDKDKGVTHIKEIELFEASSVLVGMNQYTVTAAVKDALAQLSHETPVTQEDIAKIAEKVGRTLSKKNESLIREASENLATVLAGLDEDDDETKTLESVLRESLTDAARAKFGGEDRYVWVADRDDDEKFVIVEVWSSNDESQWYKVSYERDGDDFTLSDDAEKVRRVVTYTSDEDSAGASYVAASAHASATKGRYVPEGSYEDLQMKLGDAVFDWISAEVGEWDAYFTWIEATFADSVVTATFEEDGTISYRSFPYENGTDGITLGDPSDVRVETVILPKGLMSVLRSKRAELKDSTGDDVEAAGEDGGEAPTGTAVVNESEEDEEARSSEEAPTGTEVVADEDEEETPPNDESEGDPDAEPDDVEHVPAPVGDMTEDPATRNASAELELMLMRAKQLKLVS